MLRRTAAFAVTVAVILGICGCEASVHVGGENQLSKQEVERKSRQALAKLGAPAKSVSCPAGLKLKKGASERCTLTNNRGLILRMTVTITSVSSSGEYRLHVATDSLRGAEISRQEVERKSSEALAKSVGQTPKSVSCPAGLRLKDGVKERCTLTAKGGGMIGMTVTVASVDYSSGDYRLDIAVDKR